MRLELVVCFWKLLGNEKKEISWKVRSKVWLNSFEELEKCWKWHPLEHSFSLSLTFLTLIGSSKHNPWAGWCQCDAKDATDTFDPKTLIMLSMRAQEACLKQKMWCRKEPRNRKKNRSTMSWKQIRVVNTSHKAYCKKTNKPSYTHTANRIGGAPSRDISLVLSHEQRPGTWTQFQMREILMQFICCSLFS